jgi:uncharacterized membrane protein SirB2
MAILSAQYPFVTGWLTAKLIGLLAYIVCGTVALKRGRTKQQRSVFLVIALFVYLYIVTVAVTRTPGGLLVWL